MPVAKSVPVVDTVPVKNYEVPEVVVVSYSPPPPPPTKSSPPPPPEYVVKVATPTPIAEVVPAVAVSGVRLVSPPPPPEVKASPPPSIHPPP